MFKKSAVLMSHLPYSLGLLSMMVVVTLLPNEMAVMGANYLVWRTYGGFLTISCVNRCVISNG